MTINTNPTISNILLDRSIPKFVSETYPMFEAFLGAYFEYLEQQENPIDIIKNFLAYQDIDRTLDDFITHFRYTYMKSMPRDILADEKLLFKYIRNFYHNKGNEASFRFLFKVLFNEDVEFYYPKTDILKCSDGKWQQLITIKVAQSLITNIQNVFNVTLHGLTSGAVAQVDSVFAYTERGLSIYELNLINVRGIFQLGETITTGTITFTIKNVMLEVDVTTQGAAYAVGDTFAVKDSGSTVIATGKIDSVERGPVSALNIISGGTGYSGLNRVISDYNFLPITYLYEGHNRLTSTIAALDYTEGFFTALPISFSISDATVPESPADTIVITDSPEIIGSGAIGQVTLVSQNGQILEVELIAGGKDYNIPVATVISPEGGSGADIGAIGGGGAISRVSLDNFPIDVLDSNGHDNCTVTITSQNGTSGVLTPVFGGGVIKYRGNWINDDGFLDSEKKLEDNVFYQDFSYVLRSAVPQSRWKDVIQRIIHPAGLENFGEIYFFRDFKTIVTLPEVENIHLAENLGLLADGVSHIILAEGGFLKLINS